MRRFLTRVLPGLVILVAAIVAAVALTGGSSDGDDPRLVVEAVKTPEGAEELLVAVSGRSGRDPSFATTPGAAGITCVDATGKTTVTGRHPWPWTGDVGLELPHVHQPASAQQIAATVRCRLTGTRAPVEGEVNRGSQ